MRQPWPISEPIDERSRRNENSSQSGVGRLPGVDPLLAGTMSLAKPVVRSMRKRRLPDGRVNLSSNELHHPEAPGLVAAALRRLEAHVVGTYPTYGTLVEAIAQSFGTWPEELLVAPGSDRAIRAVCQYYHHRARERAILILQAPNYVAWTDEADQIDLPVREVILRSGDIIAQSMDLLSACKEHVGALVAVSVPNGPIGGVIPPPLLDELADLARARDHLLVIDACYQVFHGPLLEQFRRRSENVLVIQSLSKSHYLAGARLGLVGGSPRHLGPLAEYRLEECVAGPSLALGVEVLAESQTFERIWAEIKTARELAFGVLQGHGLQPVPSAGNFLTCLLPAPLAEQVTAMMSSAGYRLKLLSPEDKCPSGIRLTVGDIQLTESVVATLVDVFRRLRALP